MYRCVCLFFWLPKWQCCFFTFFDGRFSRFKYTTPSCPHTLKSLAFLDCRRFFFACWDFWSLLPWPVRSPSLVSTTQKEVWCFLFQLPESRLFVLLSLSLTLSLSFTEAWWCAFALDELDNKPAAAVRSWVCVYVEDGWENGTSTNKGSKRKA